MTMALVATGAMLLGWCMGYFPNRQNHFADMKELLQQFASLSVQLIGQNSNQQPVFFPPAQGPDEVQQNPPLSDEEFLDLAGGAS